MKGLRLPVELPGNIAVVGAVAHGQYLLLVERARQARDAAGVVPIEHRRKENTASPPTPIEHRRQSQRLKARRSKQ